MFLQQLTPQQQQSFLDIAHQLALADSTISASEEAILKTFCTETGLTDYQPKSDLDIEKVLPVFDTRAAKAAVCLELLGIGYADNDFSSSEMAFIERVASGFGISSDTLP